MLKKNSTECQGKKYGIIREWNAKEGYGMSKKKYIKCWETKVWNTKENVMIF